MRTRYDAIVIGAGPAGLACSAALAEKGLEPVLLDEQAGPGGQIYRNIEQATAARKTVLGADYTDGLAAVQAFRAAGPDYLPRSRVWQADPEGSVYFSRDGVSAKVRGDFLVICTGAMERPVPFPGWTLPGVMTCGGMSNLFKDSGLYPQKPTVLAGSGPLLWLVAEHLFALEAPVAAILETMAPFQSLGALKHAPRALRRADFLFKGIKLLAAVQRAARRQKVPIYRNVSNLEAVGTDRLERVRALSWRGRQLEYEVDSLLVSEGIIPNISLLRQVGCVHDWDPVQRFWHPRTGDGGISNLPLVFVAGDGAFVHGAKSAAYKGRLAALNIAKEMRRLHRDDYLEECSRCRRNLERELHPRPFIDALYRPRPELYRIEDETVVCRCEGVTAGRIRQLVADGYVDHNEIKAIIRCGMGPCQGRMCTPAVHELIVGGSGIDPAAARLHRLRPPVKPVSLQELANAEIEENHES